MYHCGRSRESNDFSFSLSFFSLDRDVSCVPCLVMCNRTSMYSRGLVSLFLFLFFVFCVSSLSTVSDLLWFVVVFRH